ncbi:MAG: AAA family ATPase, partial [Alphaproteobacteria bacterium]|nr:AAA family ATPase [Alphaproteobacteria bacterium]
LTDHSGKTIDFRNVILIMTSNAGGVAMTKGAIGFGREMTSEKNTEALNEYFTPEFRNRLDAIIGFDHLNEEVLDKVLDKFMLQLENQLSERRVLLEATSAARQYLIRSGYDRAMGARPLARVIQEQVKRRLADEILFGELTGGGVMRIDFSETTQELTFELVERPKKREKGKGRLPATVAATPSDT